MTRLPDGWVQCRVGDLGKFINGMAFKPKDWEENGRPIIRIQNLSGTSAKYNHTKRNVLEKYVVQPGTILVSWSATLDAYLWRGPEAVLNQHIFKVVPDENLVDKEFAFWSMKNAISEMRRSAHLHGTTMKHINRGPFLAHGMSLPPLNEQRRIVAKIDALQARSRRAREALEGVPALLNRFRQSVLAAAFRGELTAQWRATHPNVEPASVLLERIRAERKARLVETQAEKARTRAEAKAAKASKPWTAEDDAATLKRERAKATKKYTEPEPVDAVKEGLPELPESWCWGRIDEISHFVTSGSRGWGKYYATEGALFIRVANLTHRGVDLILHNVAHVTPPAGSEGSRTKIQDRDILFSITADVGRVGYVQDLNEEAYVNQHVALIRPCSETCARLLAYSMANPEGVLGAATAVQYGATKASLSLEQVRSFAVPLPPLDECPILLDKLDDIIKRIELLAASASKSKLRLDAEEAACLAKAFRGGLVPQDPNDEPASELLKRIQAERAAVEAAKPKRGRKKKVATKKSAMKKSATKKSATKKSATKKSATKKASTKKSATKKASTKRGPRKSRDDKKR